MEKLQRPLQTEHSSVPLATIALARDENSDPREGHIYIVEDQWNTDYDSDPKSRTEKRVHNERMESFTPRYEATEKAAVKEGNIHN